MNLHGNYAMLLTIELDGTIYSLGRLGHDQVIEGITYVSADLEFKVATNKMDGASSKSGAGIKIPMDVPPAQLLLDNELLDQIPIQLKLWNLDTNSSEFSVQGYVASVAKETRMLNITIRTLRSLLQNDALKHTYSRTCKHKLGDHNCGITATFTACTIDGVYLGVNNKSILLTSPTDMPVGSKFYRAGQEIGMILARSSNYATPAKWDYVVSTEEYSIPYWLLPNIIFSPHCGQTYMGCDLLSNTANFGGFPALKSEQNPFTDEVLI